MTRKDYKKLAEVIGGAFATAYKRGGEEARTFVYDEVYTPLCAMLLVDNPNFRTADFSYACAVAEGKAL